MSSAEVTLGANLFVDAIDAGIPDLVASGGARTDKEDYASLGLSLRDLGRRLKKVGAIEKNEEGGWVVSSEGIAAMDEDAAAAFLPYYDTAVMAHEQASDALLAEGKNEYVDYYRDVHADRIVEIQPETVTRVRGQDMQAIVSASLNLLEAVDADPASAAFVKGLDSDAMENLRGIMSDAGFLMPGENPDRDAPIGQQSLRGTPEEQDAIFHQASAIAAGLQLPETLNVGDKPMAYAAALRGAVQGAHFDEVESDSLTGSSVSLDDLGTEFSAGEHNTNFNVLTTGIRMINSMQYDTEHLGTVLAPKELVEEVSLALDAYDRDGIENLLGRKDLEDEGISPEMGKDLVSAFSSLRDAVRNDAEDLLYSTDASRDLDENAEADDAESAPVAEAAEVDPASSGDGNSSSESDEGDSKNPDGETSRSAERDGDDRADWIVDSATKARDQASAEYFKAKSDGQTKKNGNVDNIEKAKKALDQANRGVDRAWDQHSQTHATSSLYGAVDDKVRLNEAFVMEFDRVAQVALQSGVYDYIRRRAGRAETDMENISLEPAAFGSLEEAFGKNRVATTPEVSDRMSEAMSFQRWNNLNPERKSRMNVAMVAPGREPFRGQPFMDKDGNLVRRDYKPAAASVAGRRLSSWIDDNLFMKDAKTGEPDRSRPNLNMRRFLRDAATRPVVATSTNEAKAMRAYAEAFINREQEEHRLRMEQERSQTPTTSFDLAASDVDRFLKVAEASGSKDPARVTLKSDGTAFLSHPEAPRLESRLDKVPEPLAKSGDKGRAFGGQITTEQLKAAYQTGADKVSVLISGETPIGVVGKLHQKDEQAREAPKPKRRYEDMALS